jgi:eukaryotic-like serine/threonine-protein kinase
MGVVWRARDELLSRDVAVKEMIWPPYLSGQERQAACRRATRKAQVAARLNHRNVIRIFDIVEEDGCPWIIMDLLSNILIGPGNRVVIDFGIAWAADSPAVTTAGVLLGYPPYIAPERARSGRCSAACSARTWTSG